MIQRRSFLQMAGTAAVLAAPAARAQFRVEISGIGATQIPIAIAPFRDEEKAPVAASAVVRADLERSGMFRLIDAPGGMDERSQPAMADWRTRGADALAAGSSSRLVDGRFDLRYRLWDVVKGKDVAAQALAVLPADLRLGSHRIADEIFEKLTGTKGVFSTRIAYVSKIGSRYSLWVADADGEGAQAALTSPEPIISPAWSPSGRELAYVSFEAHKAVVVVQDVATSARRVIANFRGSNSAPAWSPDGETLAVTLSRDGGSQLFLISRTGANVRRLVQSSAIDTEAVWSADGKSIYFTSDRGGSPQIYRTGPAGSAVERVTFQGSYNISPSLSPDGRYLAYITREGGSTFKLMLMELASGTVTPLTDTNDDEHPSFAPNGKLIMYASRINGRDVLMTTTLDGRIKARLAVPQADVRQPAWGPFGR